ncbi:MAG: phosphoribosylglycinamide formyltransferase [Verrucomicrobia bacterium]|nr:phosphoribosylglycinamide formyltransferase [Verrucomicrobiota bacterium]MBU4367205.1 phosphoribosylglycinamide formyltransferase [Verrucomicrobiota bacterium]
MTTTPMAIAVLGSGRGTNFKALAEAINDGRLDARIVCVLSNVENAFILERARQMRIPAEYIDPAPFRTKLDGTAEQQAINRLRHYGAELIALAGFMLIIKPRLLKAFAGRIVNIHPSLLPSFPGLEAWKQALAYGVKVAGCTVHYVDAGTDTGPIILQRPVSVLEGDTAESLHARIQEHEHLAYPAAIRQVIAVIRGQSPH